MHACVLFSQMLLPPKYEDAIKMQVDPNPPPPYVQ